jgi:hypothetical protein
MYAKRINKIWNIHIEVTFAKRFLTENELETDIPTSVSPNWLTGLPLHNFLSFAAFCRSGFSKAMLNTDAIKKWKQEQEAEKRRYKRPHPYKVLLEAARCRPACEQKRIAYTIAESLGAKRLKKRVNDGEFDCPYNLFAE